MKEKFEYLGNGYYCLTDAENKITYDPLLLSYFAEVGDDVLDLCSGNGIIALLMHKKGCKNVTAIEINRNAITLAKQGADKSDADIDFICGDIKNIKDLLTRKFDVITVNPPYFKGKKGNNNRRNEIRNEYSLTLNEIISAAAFALKDGGRLYMCHRPDRENEIIKELNNHSLSPSKILKVHDNPTKDAFLILIEAVKGQADFKDMGRFYLKENGEYTKKAKSIFFPERND